MRLARKFSIEEASFDYFLTDYAKKEYENMKDYTTSLSDLFNSKTRFIISLRKYIITLIDVIIFSSLI